MFRFTVHLDKEDKDIDKACFQLCKFELTGRQSLILEQKPVICQDFCQKLHQIGRGFSVQVGLCLGSPLPHCEQNDTHV